MSYSECGKPGNRERLIKESMATQGDNATFTQRYTSQHMKNHVKLPFGFLLSTA